MGPSISSNMVRRHTHRSTTPPRAGSTKTGLQISGQVPSGGEAGDLERRLDRLRGRQHDRPVSADLPTPEDAPNASEIPLCGYPRFAGRQTTGLDGLADTDRHVERGGRPILQVGEVLEDLDARRPDRTDERHEGRLEEADIPPLNRHLGKRPATAALP